MNQLTRFNALTRLFLDVLLVGVLLLVSGCASPGRSVATPTATTPAPATAASRPTPAASATTPPPPTNPEPAAPPTAEPSATATATAPLAAGGPLVLLYAPDGHLYRGAVETGLGRRLTTKPSALGVIPGYGPPLVSPDGRLLALNGNWGGATALDLTTGELIGPGRGRGIHKPSWSPDSQRLAYMAANGQLCIYHLDDAPADCIFGNSRLQEILWSPTAEVIAAAVTDPMAEGSIDCCTGQVWLVDALTGEASAIPVAYATGFEGAPNEVLAWLPDGAGLVIKKTADGRGAIYHTGDSSRTDFAEPIRSVSPDGRMVLHPSGAVSNVDGSARFTLPGAAGCPSGAHLVYVWSPDGAKLATRWVCFRTDGGSDPVAPLTVFDTATGAPLWQQPLAPDTWPVAWSPDGAYLLLQENATGLENYDQLGDYALWQVAADGGTPELVAQGAVLLATIPQRPEPSARAGRPLFFARNDDLYRADLAGGNVEQLTTGGRLRWGMTEGDEWRVVALSAPPRVSPDGRRLAFSPDGDSVVIVAVGADGAPMTLPGSAIYAWSPDGQRLAAAVHVGDEARAQLVVYDAATATAAPLLPAPLADISALAWSPDGGRIAFGCCFAAGAATGGDTGVEIGRLQVVDAGLAGQAAGQVTTLGPLSRSVGGGVQLCWPEDDPAAASAAPDTGTTATHCRTQAYVVSPDGRQRAYLAIPPDAPDAYRLVIEEVATGETHQRDLATDLFPVGWSPDGQYLFLDDGRGDSPIWRLPAGGRGDLEAIIDDGYLLAIVDAW
ncbi:MAG: PD40 domain-containing protein [Anaerolineae bacterium]|nr:PD40 domain-containing protein [Anaerolineae bacterium]